MIDQKKIYPNYLVSYYAYFKFIFLIPIIFLFFPWHQNIVAHGKVSAFSASNRIQYISSPIEGLISNWYVEEGELVKKGQKLLEIVDVDPNYSMRLDKKNENLLLKKESKQSELKAYKLLNENYENSKNAKLKALQAKINALDITIDTAKYQFERLSRLFTEGLVSKRDLELSERDLEVVKREMLAVKSDRDDISAEMNGKIDANAATINKLKSELAEIENELIKNDVDRSRQASRLIVAPADGYIYRLNANSLASVLKVGQSILTLVPSDSARSVELEVDGRDIPLLKKDGEVRIEFEGWPAIQVSGWAKLGVGTFKGRISFVDSFDIGNGNFRVMVIPDESEKWPSDQYLKQGTSVKAWMFLDKVTIAYEIWRLINGFPPRMPEDLKTELKP